MVWGEIPITEQAMFQRIQRKLEKEYKKLYKSRTDMQKKNFGTYFIVNNANAVVESHIESIETLARELNVISGREYLEETTSQQRQQLNTA